MVKENNYILYHISIVLLIIDGANKKVVLLIRYTTTIAIYSCRYKGICLNGKRRSTGVNKRANKNIKVVKMPVTEFTVAGIIGI